ncbi:MAG: GntR family transcriptional regulator [Rhodospirillaceae bacterium]|nr:GntR family transcriptional regulator [Rhodospirillaceae bacterium]MBT4771066.1 GntR family transcriptional regulator [Rhodospirillaceae bacterium]MBT5357691.1 GntR family transcriptional regulator [Rhodospirillaceae bacterium]MBT6308929.1 GntR family transcriptional regulator [Rhodospirillaceae bacterium]
MSDLNTNDGRPLYQVIADELRTRIVRGEYALGAMLPTEKDLLTHYGVSRHTVRAALQQLREQGFVSMRRGSGTRVVSTSPGATYVQSVSTLSELLQYPDTTFELADMGTVTLVHAQAARLSLTAGSTWFRISGLRRSDVSRAPICWQEIYVLPEFENTARRVLTEHGPVHKIIESAHSEVIANAQLEMFASRIDASLAARLEVEPDTAAMTINRRYTSQDGRVFETTISIHPEDRFVYSLELSRDWNTS